jgi:hypothetical protein
MGTEAEIPPLLPWGYLTSGCVEINLPALM